MIPSRPPACMFCKRFDKNSSTPPTCTSFPNGIPDIIFDALHSHEQPLKNEPTFLGTIPPGWEDLALDAPADVPSNAAGWTPAKRY